MMVQPLKDAIAAAQKEAGQKTKVVYLSPQGKTLTHQHVQEIAQNEKLILVCGRYEGIDERLIQSCVDEQWSIGDYVLSGGELPAMTLIDAVSRFVPGVLGKQESADQDSFAEGLLDCPHYTRPEELDGLKVPEVLLSGNHEKIRQWRLQQSLGRTWLYRPELLNDLALTDEKQALLNAFIEQEQSQADSLSRKETTNE